MEVCSAYGGGVLLDSKVFIALCRPVMRLLFVKHSRLDGTFEREKEVVGGTESKL